MTESIQDLEVSPYNKPVKMNEHRSIKVSTDTEKKMVWLIMPISSAGTGVLFGAVVAYIAGDMFTDILGFSVNWWQGAMAGLAIGSTLGIVGAFRACRQIDDLKQSAEQLGLQGLEPKETSQVSTNVRKMIGERSKLGRCYSISENGVTLVLGDLTFFGQRSKSADGSESTRPDDFQTCIYSELQGIDIPAFEMQPERLWARFAGFAAGVEDIDFIDSPNFSKQYFLQSDQPDRTRQFFDLELRQLLEQHQGYHLMGSGNRMLLFKKNKICKKHEYQSYLQTAMKIFLSMQRAANAMS